MPNMLLGLEGAPARIKGIDDLVGRRTTIGSVTLAELIPIAHVKVGDYIRCERKIVPKSLEAIDDLLRSPQTGDTDYQEARAHLFALNGRSKLAQSMLECAVDDGFSCGDLEEKLSGKKEFTLQDYRRIVEDHYYPATELSSEELSTPKVSRQYILDQLTGRYLHPHHNHWGILRAYAVVSKKAEDVFEPMHASQEEFITEGVHGTYWAVRVYDGLRAVLRSKALYHFERKQSQKQKRPASGTSSKKISFEKHVARYADNLADDILTEGYYAKVISTTPLAAHPKIREGQSSVGESRLPEDIFTTGQSAVEVRHGGMVAKKKAVLAIDYFSMQLILDSLVAASYMKLHEEDAKDLQKLGFVTYATVGILTGSEIVQKIKRQSQNDVAGHVGLLRSHTQELVDLVNSGRIDSSLNMPEGETYRIAEIVHDLWKQVPEALKKAADIMVTQIPHYSQLQFLISGGPNDTRIAESHHRIVKDLDVSTMLFTPVITSDTVRLLGNGENRQKNDFTLGLAGLYVKICGQIEQQKKNGSGLVYDIHGKLIGRCMSKEFISPLLRSYSLNADMIFSNLDGSLSIPYFAPIFLERQEIIKNSQAILQDPQVREAVYTSQLALPVLEVGKQ